MAIFNDVYCYNSKQFPAKPILKKWREWERDERIKTPLEKIK